jgi:hypothetical protein
MIGVRWTIDVLANDQRLRGVHTYAHTGFEPVGGPDEAPFDPTERQGTR